jgi:hypothetical protein
MSRIALITKKLHPQVINLAQQLVLHRHDVVVITGREQTPQNPTEFEIIYPFKKWSALEAIRLFPRLLGQMPDVFHFVFTEPNETPTMAHFILSRLVLPIPRRVIASSFFHSPSEMSHFRLKYFLPASQLVTWGTSAHLLRARRSLKISRNTVSEVLPPLSPFSGNQAAQPSHEIQYLCQSFGKYFLIPGGPESFFDRVNLGEFHFDEKYKLVFLSARPDERKQNIEVFYLHDLPSPDLEYAICKAKGILLSFSDLSLLELMQYYQWSASSKTPLLVRPQQTEMFPGLVKDQKTGWVLHNGERSLRELIRQNPLLRLPKKPDEEPSFEIIDSTMNELNRLYNKAIALRS